jgi:hypothetical protein
VRLLIGVYGDDERMKGFSTRILKLMRKFAEEDPDTVFVQEVLAQLTWYHI